MAPAMDPSAQNLGKDFGNLVSADAGPDDSCFPSGKMNITNVKIMEFNWI